jgi:chromosome segregation ATPase
MTGLNRNFDKKHGFWGFWFMNTLDSKIRAHQWSLDEKRRKVDELEALAANFRTKIEQFERDIKVAREIAAVNPSKADLSNERVLAAMSRRDKLAQSLKRLESEMVQALEDVDNAYQEYRKFDVIKARSRKRLA